MLKEREKKKASTTRDLTITIRLSEQEKELFEEGAKQAMRSVSDYIRTLVVKDVFSNEKR